MSTSDDVGERPPLPLMLARGVLRRCAWCGGRGAFFVGWARKADRCATCGLEWRRGDVGFELGAAAAAAIICMGPLVAALGLVAALTWPDLPVVELLVVLGVGGVVLPVVLYPSSYTTWQAIDLLMRPVEPDDFGPVDGRVRGSGRARGGDRPA